MFSLTAIRATTCPLPVQEFRLADTTDSKAIATTTPSIPLMLVNISGGHMAMTIVLPSLPAIALALKASTPTTQLVFTLYVVAFAAAQLIAGPVSDRFGRRPVLIAGLALFAVSSLICALTDNIWVLIVARIFQGAGACTGMVVTRAMIRDVYGEAHTGRILSYAAMAMGAAPAFAPVIGGYLEIWYGWRAGLWLTTGYATIAFIATWALLVETRARTLGGGAMVTMIRGYGVLLRTPVFLYYVVIGASLTGAFFAFVSSAPLVFIGALGVSPDILSLLIAMLPLGYVFGSFAAARLMIRLGVVRLVLFSGVCVIISTAGFLFVSLAGVRDPTILMGPLFVMGVCHGMAAPSALAGVVSARPDLAGTAAALAGCLQVAFGALVALGMGALTYTDQLPTIYVMMVFSVIGLAAALAVARASQN
jgi:DHA1 family bicyclomycin/chloramphenicol resistance-like MFS transporter